MPRLEEITYDIARAALAEQEGFVNGIRLRAGTLVATQALVASFLGRAALDEGPLNAWGWGAMTILSLGLVLATAVLAPWPMHFALGAMETYDDVADQMPDRPSDDALEWLLRIAFTYVAVVDRNQQRVSWLTWATSGLVVATIVQTGLWIVAIGVA